MEKRLNQLKDIKKVEAPDHLYDSILSKIAEEKKPRLAWLGRSIAAAVILLFVADAYVILTPEEDQVVEDMEYVINSEYIYYE